MKLTRRQFLRWGTQSGAAVAVMSLTNCEKAEVATEIEMKAQPMVTSEDRAFVLNHYPQAPINETHWRLRLKRANSDDLNLSLTDLHNHANRICALASVVCVFDGPDQDLAYTGIFEGVAIKDLLGEPAPETRRILVHAADGYTSSLPLSILEQRGDDVPAFLATNYLGKPLSHERGFPARLIVPGYYAYKHVKYVTQLSYSNESQASGDFESMFRDAPDRALSGSTKISHPLDTSIVSAGKLVLTGYALPSSAPVTRVEVRINQGPWRPARLVAAESIAKEIHDLGARLPIQVANAREYPFAGVWAPWVFNWHAEPGEYSIQVRAHTAAVAYVPKDQYQPDPGQTIQITVL